MPFLDILIPLFTFKKCYSCQQEGHFFCPQCCYNLEKYKAYCYVCKKESPGFYIHKKCISQSSYISQFIVLTRYKQDAIKKSLRSAKYYKKTGIYLDLLQGNKDFFLTYVSSQNSICIPVPMSFMRRWKRGYNQSEIIAKNIGKICNVPVNTSFIKKVKHTKQQSKLGIHERKTNLQGAFRLHKIHKIPKEIQIYLVDDIVSSASTLSEIAELLYKNGYKNISAICLASD